MHANTLCCINYLEEHQLKPYFVFFILFLKLFLMLFTGEKEQLLPFSTHASNFQTE